MHRVENIEVSATSQLASAQATKYFPARAAILLLVLAVAGLSIVAKRNQCLPKSNPAHYLAAANRVNLNHAPVVLDRVPLRPVAMLILPQPVVRRTQMNRREMPPVQRISLALSLQHRSPPAPLA